MSLPKNIDPAELDAASLQQYQAIYESLTQRAEKRLTFRNERHKVAIEDLLGLHKLIEQTAHTMEIVHSAVYITQRSADGTSERWSAFEKFRLHGPTVGQVTTDVEIVYNFLIKLPHTDEPGRYKVLIGLRNSLHELEKHRANSEELEAFELFMMSKMATARWEIEFTDMSVARTFGQTIDAWYENLATHPIPFAETLSKRCKGYAPALVRILSALIISFAVFGPEFWANSQIDSGKFASFILLMYGTHFLTTPLISRLDKKLMCIRTAASLKITSPDAELIDEDERKRGRLVKWIWANALLPQLPAALIVGFKYLKALLQNPV